MRFLVPLVLLILSLIRASSVVAGVLEPLCRNIVERLQSQPLTWTRDNVRVSVSQDNCRIDRTAGDDEFTHKEVVAILKEVDRHLRGGHETKMPEVHLKLRKRKRSNAKDVAKVRLIITIKEEK